MNFEARTNLPWPRLAWAWLLVAASANGVEVERWQQPAVVLRSFYEIALRSEYGPDAMLLRKWVSPIAIWIDHRVGDKEKHIRLTRTHVEHLMAMTNHPMAIVSDPKQANVRLIFTREMNFAQDVMHELGQSAARVVRQATCISSFQTVNGVIVKAAIVIPVDRANAQRKLLACIVEELTQTLGLPNDSDQVFPSIFNDHTPQYLLSGLDYLLIRILYDPRMRAGMPKDEAMVMAQKIIGEMQATIRDASRLVTTGALYRPLDAVSP